MSTGENFTPDEQPDFFTVPDARGALVRSVKGMFPDDLVCLPPDCIVANDVGRMFIDTKFRYTDATEAAEPNVDVDGWVGIMRLYNLNPDRSLTDGYLVDIRMAAECNIAVESDEVIAGRGLREACGFVYEQVDRPGSIRYRGGADPCLQEAAGILINFVDDVAEEMEGDLEIEVVPIEDETTEASIPEQSTPHPDKKKSKKKKDS